VEISYNRLIRYHTRKKKRSAQDVWKKMALVSPTYSELSRARMKFSY